MTPGIAYLKSPAKAGQAGDGAVRDSEQTPTKVGAFQPGGKPGKPLLARGLQGEPEVGAAINGWGQGFPAILLLLSPCSQPSCWE